MNREIKFRAWDKDNLQMYFSDQIIDSEVWEIDHSGIRFLEKRTIDSYPGGQYHEQTEEWVAPNQILMQFTGLLDKNGKEIYEFDYLEDVAGGILCVFWGSGKYILQNISSGDIIDCNETNTQNKTIVGNRFEHPREHKAMETDL